MSHSLKEKGKLITLKDEINGEIEERFEENELDITGINSLTCAAAIAIQQV
jgi:hypothetical protein